MIEIIKSPRPSQLDFEFIRTLEGEFVASNCYSDVAHNREFVDKATSHVLMAGLGLGTCINEILDKPDVLTMTVLEINPDVIRLVSPRFQKHLDSGRLIIKEMDCFKHQPSMFYGAVFHDVWNGITRKHLPIMQEMRNRYAKFTNNHFISMEKLCTEVVEE